MTTATTNRKECPMALSTTAPEPVVVEVEKVRLLKRSEVHVIETKVLRLDGSGTLASAIVDLIAGTVQIRQETTPITFKSPADFDDLIEFYTNARDLLAGAPTPVIAPAKA
jgi:hypothetical protein